MKNCTAGSRTRSSPSGTSRGRKTVISPCGGFAPWASACVISNRRASGVAEWFAGRPEVKSVLHPALPSDPGHALWKRDFSGASSVFGVVLETDSEKAVGRMVDGYRFFKIGASWGGFESLVIPAYPADIRTAVLWKEEGFVLRFHIGLEDADDLIADLEEGFSRLNEALDA